MFLDNWRKKAVRLWSEPVEKLEDDIVGYEDLKQFLQLYEASDQEMNVMMYGPPGSGKSTFKKWAEKRFPNLIKYNCETATGRGIIMLLVERFASNVQKKKMGLVRIASDEHITIWLEEVDKIKPKTDLGILLDLLQEKEIIYTKFGFHVAMTLPNLRVFATCNEIKKPPGPFRDRFEKFYLRAYNKEEFQEIARRICHKYLRSNVKETREDIALEIADKLFTRGETGVRELERTMKMYEIWRGTKTVDEVLAFKEKYSEPKEVETK
jgi:MoxR-like ATPase